MTIPNFIIWKTNRGPLLLSSPDKTKDTELIKIVLLYFKKILLKKQVSIDIPCFIVKRQQKSLEKFYHIECKDMGSLQILAPLMKNPNAPFPSGSMARSSRFLKRYAGFTPIQVSSCCKYTATNPQSLSSFMWQSEWSIVGGEGFTPISWAAFHGLAEVVGSLGAFSCQP